MSDEVKQCPCGKCHCPFYGNRMKRDALKAENERLRAMCEKLGDSLAELTNAGLADLKPLPGQIHKAFDSLAEYEKWKG